MLPEGKVDVVRLWLRCVIKAWPERYLLRDQSGFGVMIKPSAAIRSRGFASRLPGKDSSVLFCDE
jgi:hypothetical protein